MEFHEYEDADHGFYATRRVFHLLDAIVSFFEERLGSRGGPGVRPGG